MKRLIAALIALFTAGISAADESQAAGFPNNAGGWTVITTRTDYCGARDMRDGYAFGTGGAGYTRLCWLARNDKVLAVLETGENLIWSIHSFEELVAEPEINNNKL